MVVKIIQNCPTHATVIMSDGSIMLTKSGVLYDEDEDVIMTIGNYKEAMTKNASTDESEPRREDLH